MKTKQKKSTRSRRAWIKDLKEDGETASRKEAIGNPCDQEYNNGRNFLRFILLTSLVPYVYISRTHTVTKLNGTLPGYRNKVLLHIVPLYYGRINKINPASYSQLANL
jgi:hypothetical protein